MIKVEYPNILNIFIPNNAMNPPNVNIKTVSIPNNIINIVFKHVKIKSINASVNVS